MFGPATKSYIGIGRFDRLKYRKNQKLACKSRLACIKRRALLGSSILARFCTGGAVVEPEWNREVKVMGLRREWSSSTDVVWLLQNAVVARRECVMQRS